MRWCSAVAVIVALAPSQSKAQATDTDGASGETGRRPLHWNASDPQRDTGSDQPRTARRHGEQHPFAYTLDPSTPYAGELGVEYLLQGTSGVEAIRPLAANLGAQGAVHGVTVRFGAANWIAPFATGLVLQPIDVEGAKTEATGQAGAQVQFTRPDSKFRLGLQTAFLREFAGDMGVFTRATASYDMGILRVAGNAHFEKIFAEGRDGIDILAFAGASVRATDAVRVGVEYVGQDLEDAIEDEEAEGGARHFAGAVAAVELADGAFWITAGPAFGLNKQSPDLMGRLTVVALF